MPTDRPTFEALKDFLAETSPILVKARESLHEEGKMFVDSDDRIYVIESRTDCSLWKGQNQRTFEISFFPRRIVEDLSGRRNPDISKPLKNSFIHTGHGSHQGKTWGNPEFIDDVYLRNPMNPADVPGASPEGIGARLQTRTSMRGGGNQPEVIKAGEGRRPQLRPAPTAPSVPKPPSVKSMPNLKAEAAQHVKEDSLIDLSAEERLYYNTGGSQTVSSSNLLLDNSLSEQISINDSMADRSYQNEEFQYQQPQQQQESEMEILETIHDVDQNISSQYMNQLEVESHQRQGSHDTSFSSLAPGETYHYPPEEDDPFDTSNVTIPQLNSTPRSDVGGLETALSSLKLPGTAGPPSIISQLLASQPSSQSSSPQPGVTPGVTPPPTRRVTASEPRHLLVPPGLSARHRRAVSTMSEAETFLPPLTSPFSPPAFNPYDIVLGSNEAIAGLESPAPFGNKSRRDQAFSWLDDKIGNLKSSKSSQNLAEQSGGGGGGHDVFQFPNVRDSNVEQGDDSELLRQQEIERQQEINRQKELERQQEHNRQQEMERQQELNRQKEMERQQEIERQQELYQQQEMARKQEMVRQQLVQQQLEIQKQQQLLKQQEQQQEQERIKQQELLRKQEQQQEFLRQQEQHQLQERLRQQQQQQHLQRQQEQEQELLRQQKEMEQRELQQRQEMIRQQEMLMQQELARQQRENEMAKHNMKILMEKQRMQQADQEQRMKYLNQQQQQHQFSYQQKEQELQQKNLQKILNFNKSSAAVAPANSQEVFHFPQTSSLSTAGQELPPYSVDKDFIKDLEKSLGATDAVANMLGPQAPPTPSLKVANIPSLQLPPPPANPAAVRSSPGSQGGARPRSSPRQEVGTGARSVSRASGGSGGRAGSRASSRQETEAEARTAHVKPFHHQAEPPVTPGKMGDVIGAAASSGWRSLSLHSQKGQQARVDLLASQRTQLDSFRGRPEEAQSESFGTTRGTSSNAVEINKIAQCSKMVPGMSGTEIRSALEAVNWDTSVAVKNLKIDKLFRIGVATKPKCEKVLQAVSWDLERAASKLLDSL